MIGRTVITVSLVLPVIWASGNKTDVCAPQCKMNNAKFRRSSVPRQMVLKFEFFILADGGDCEGVTNAHVRAGMLRIKDPLHGPQDDIGEGKHDGALGENE